LYRDTRAIRYHNRLRRISAVLLLILFSFSLLAPALASNADSNLPACCRRAGKHHCSMAAHSGSPQNGPGLAANKMCPLYGQTGAVQSESLIALGSQGVSFRTPRIVYAGGTPRIRSNLSAFRVKAHLQRGPPFFNLIG